MNDKSLNQQQRDAAAATYLISQTGFRVGSDANTGADKKAFGATNLLGSHVSVKGNDISFNFVGKKGVDQAHTITDPALAKYIAGRQQEVGSKGRLFATNDGKVRDYFHGIAGENFKVKDFRTQKATVEALRAVKSMPVPTTKSGFAKARAAVGDHVAKVLGNTRSMALNSYIHPAVFHSWGFQNAK
jgi:DNA topoisomerase-1